MMILKRLLFALAGCLFLQTGIAQNALHIEVVDTNAIPSTIQLDSSFTFAVKVRNDSATTFIGQIGFAYRVDTSFASGSSTVSGFEYVTTNDTLQSSDSTIKTIKAHISIPLFKAGPSVVVIWPISNGATAKDSVRFNLMVQQPSGIDDEESAKIKMRVWDKQLYIEKPFEIRLSRVRLFDASGRAIIERQNPSNQTPLPDMNTGIYIAEITLGNHQRRVLRFYYSEL